ncbi:hypothetical protein SE17_08770 [Kouleothrix aurantiaca]|uniref:PsbP C-terminal domain-containing protein n=1 Tax=Kouleothrix aurantiaca TaxID=186479 RepID=A0A0N8PST1_9CHLR|nr:hypothetical protein SE17_08770 [Kouleothrix aurantiaca]
MMQSTDQGALYRLRLARKDIGVAVVVLLALALGWLLRMQVESRTRQFAEEGAAFSITYPATWNATDTLQDALLKISDPLTASSFKTNLTIERRDADPASPLDLQTLLDRRVEQHGALTGYHFLNNSDATVGGVHSSSIDYAYVVQPIDQPRRPSLPVVVQAREYIVAAAGRTYYITLAAPAEDFDAARTQFERMIQTVKIQ